MRERRLQDFDSWSVNKRSGGHLMEIGSPQLKELMWWILPPSDGSASRLPARLSAGDGRKPPAELRERPQWVAWRYEVRKGKPTKVPIKPSSGGKAKSNDSSTWDTFDAALRAANCMDIPGSVSSSPATTIFSASIWTPAEIHARAC